MFSESNSLNGTRYNSDVIKFVSDLQRSWFTTGTPVSSVNKIARHYIAEILLQIPLKIPFPTLPTLNERSNVMICCSKIPIKLKYFILSI